MLLIIQQRLGIIVFSLFVLEVSNIDYSTITFSYYNNVKIDIFKKSSHLQH